MKVETKWNRLYDIRILMMIIFIIPSVLIHKDVNSFVIGILLINILSFLMDGVDLLREINSKIKEDE
jgi:hypothetical protein